MKEEQWVQLADHQIPDVRVAENPKYALGSSNLPYRKLMIWEGFFNDSYLVDMETGRKRKIAEKLISGAELSPGGKFVVFYEERNWHLYNIEKDLYTHLTSSLEVPFHNEDHDYPSPVPGYGVAGWMENGKAGL